jgi:type I restriction enzyme S subunit
MSFPRYPKYKDSGVEWLGQVPEDWEVKRLKRICHVFPSNVDKKTVEGETPVLLCNYTDVYYNDQIVADMDFMPATATDDQIAKFALRAGDTIITKDSETADDIAVAAHVPNDLPGVVCGYHLSMVRPREGIHGAFVKRLFDSAYAKSCFAVRANGLTRVGLSQYELDNVDMPVPTPAEQTAIAAFLDRETAKIDALIAEQQRLIELLQEKRQAVISHAVTKGLNPDAPMKDSDAVGMEKIPAHWDIKPLKHVVAVDSCGCYGVDPEESEITLPVATTAQIDTDGRFAVEEMPVRGFSSAELDRYRCGDGDILVVKSSGSATNIISGKAGYVDAETPLFIFSNFLMRLRPLTHFAAPRFIYWLLRSRLTRQRVEQMCATTTYPNLKVSEYTAAPIPLPPLNEQHVVAGFIDRHVKMSDSLIEEAEHAIALLQERRAALISAAVTGQIDVRGLAGSEAA